MKYRYIEFKSSRMNKYSREGKLFFVGKPSQELIDELELEEAPGSSDGSIKLYLSTLASLGEKGWELQFVSPCGLMLNSNGGKTGGKTGGQIDNTYIFRKVEEDR
jgi:hypothetical protein